MVIGGLRRRACAFWIAFVVILVSAPVGNGQTPELNTAGVYVDFGDGTSTTVVVPFAETEISSMELLERSGLPVLTVGFGGLGGAVCMIEEKGCDVSACRRTLCQDGDRESPFWQFLELGDDGTWVTSPLGASTASVADGGVNAWVWTGTKPALPEMQIESLVAQTGYSGEEEPAIVSTLNRSEESESNRQSLILAVAVTGIAVVIALGLVFAKRRKDALR